MKERQTVPRDLDAVESETRALIYDQRVADVIGTHVAGIMRHREWGAGSVWGDGSGLVVQRRDNVHVDVADAVDVDNAHVVADFDNVDNADFVVERRHAD